MLKNIDEFLLCKPYVFIWSLLVGRFGYFSFFYTVTPIISCITVRAGGLLGPTRRARHIEHPITW